MILRYAVQYTAGAMSQMMNAGIVYGVIYIALADKILPLFN